ncbi:alkaline phosphatase family protein [Mycolicibacterium flavescens]|uniref:Phosphodiesterase n=1 Tax=Mycolicibacterium flavescens TaxID=1776 RepID=A0A1E3RNY9_MYCFV|nr:alkaline phosphatase family protein [Mycolicibacterium flavescens]MCV7281362.1 alkaline phosphatase family protein [Mycolicibacterium flavescens]ODQ91132.1 hypothetical protein BHQ18_06970 [Mycolicibacterium flavescens]
MGYARYIGRVGALAVTLGVGVAVASTPGIAYADETGSSPSASGSTTSTSTGGGSPTGAEGGTAGTGTNGDDDDDAGTEATDPSDTEEDDDEVEPAEDQEDADLGDDELADGELDDVDEDDEGSGDEQQQEPPAAPDQTSETGKNDDSPAGNDDGVQQQDSAATNAAVTAESNDPAPVGDDATESESKPELSLMSFTSTDGPETFDSAAAFRTAATTTTTTTPVTAPVPQPLEVLVQLVNDVVTAIFQPFLGPGNWSPFNSSLLTGMLSLVRNEFDRISNRRPSQYSVTQIAGPSLLADSNPNVLVIGVDGTNLSRILADDYNQNFFALMDDGTTAASSIVGHTTLSNPSWTSILTGAWGEKTGVINNIWTPWTYDKFPTVFTLLENHNPDIDTTNIANWDVINAIAGTGERYVDTNIFVPHLPNDPYWDATDDAIGQATVDAIAATATGKPTFMFSYFVGVDENGHAYGGASEEYKLSIRNVNDNLGAILQAIEDWETANPDEGEWTVIVVTDHGHQPQRGFGHGFQTPSETATFVIASGPDFKDGWVNPEYEIVDTTPTVLTLFGAPVPGYSDGVSLTSLAGSDEDPVDLHQALQDMIATNTNPGLITTVALGTRTIFSSIPYFIMDFTTGTPFAILGDILYVPTNFVAQIVALLTGVHGARIFPILPPPAPTWPPDTEQQQQATVLVLNCRTAGVADENACGAGSVA